MTDITTGFYSGHKVFNYPERVTFVGVLKHKLMRDRSLRLSYLPGKPMVYVSDDLVRLSDDKGWTNTRNGKTIKYFPENLLLQSRLKRKGVVKL